MGQRDESGSQKRWDQVCVRTCGVAAGTPAAVHTAGAPGSRGRLALPSAPSTPQSPGLRSGWQTAQKPKGSGRQGQPAAWGPGAQKPSRRRKAPDAGSPAHPPAERTDARTPGPLSQSDQMAVLASRGPSQLTRALTRWHTGTLFNKSHGGVSETGTGGNLTPATEQRGWKP